MKAFLAAVLAIGVIAFGAQAYLATLGFSSAEIFASDNVRLSDCPAGSTEAADGSCREEAPQEY